MTDTHTRQPHPQRCETCSHYGGHICYQQHNRMSNIELTLIEMVGCASHSSAPEPEHGRWRDKDDIQRRRPMSERFMEIYTGTSWNKENLVKCEEYDIGMVSTPKDPVQPDKISNKIKVIWDNGAFHGGFNAPLWRKQTDKIHREIKFAVIPDVVGKAKESLELSKFWLDQIPFKKYLALQDGMDFDMVYPLLSECDGAFLGGSVQWKWDTLSYWVPKVHALGLKFHVGRCNGLIQWDRAYWCGADSVDGSTVIRHNLLDTIPKFYIHAIEQRRLVHYIEKLGAP